MTESRKRIRSEEDNFVLQSKYFVNQQLVDKSNDQLMKNVYEKTLNMIFAGARKQKQNLQNKPNNFNDSLIVDTIDDKLPEPQGCKLCWKDINPSSNFICRNCNLKICEKCETNCINCHCVLCSNCVQIFGCSFGDNPICEECKFFIE